MASLGSIDVEITARTDNFINGVRGAKDAINTLGNHATILGGKLPQGFDRGTEAVRGYSASTKQAVIDTKGLTLSMVGLGTTIIGIATASSRLGVASNRLEKSQVAVQRINNQIATTQKNLNKLIDAGKQNTEDYAVQVSKLETAYADLKTKEEDVKLAQDALNDTQILFATTIVNTAINSIFLMRSAFSGLSLAQLKTTLTTKLFGSTLVTTGAATPVYTLGMQGATFWTHGFGLALKTAIPPLIAVTAAFAAWEGLVAPFIKDQTGVNLSVLDWTDSMLGAKDAVEEVNTDLEEYKRLLGDTTASTDDQTDAMRKLFGLVENSDNHPMVTFWNNVRFAQDGVLDRIAKIKDGMVAVEGAAVAAGFPSGSQQGAIQTVGSGSIRVPTSSTGTRSAQEQKQISREVTQVIKEREDPKLDKAIADATLKGFSGKPPTYKEVFGKTVEQEFKDRGFLGTGVSSFEEFKRSGFIVAKADFRFKESERSGALVSRAPFSLSSATNPTLLDQLKLSPVTKFRKTQIERLLQQAAQGSDADKIFLAQVLSSELVSLSNDPLDKLSVTFDALLAELDLVDPGFGKGTVDTSIFKAVDGFGIFSDINPNTRKGRRQLKELRIEKHGGKDDLFRDLSEELVGGSTRDFVKRVIGFDIGETANTLSRNDAIRIAILEKTLANSGLGTATNNAGRQISNTRTIQALLNNGGRSTGLSTGRGGFGGVSATAAFQVPRGSINIPQSVRDEIAEKNAFAKSFAGALNIEGGSILSHALSQLTAFETGQFGTAQAFVLGRTQADLIASRGGLGTGLEAKATFAITSGLVTRKQLNELRANAGERGNASVVRALAQITDAFPRWAEVSAATGAFLSATGQILPVDRVWNPHAGKFQQSPNVLGNTIRSITRLREFVLRSVEGRPITVAEADVFTNRFLTLSREAEVFNTLGTSVAAEFFKDNIDTRNEVLRLEARAYYIEREERASIA